MREYEKKQHTIDIVFVLTLLCVFTVCSLIVVYIGSSIYSSTVKTMDIQFNNHTAIDYITERIHANNRIKDIEVISKDGIDVLCLHEKDNQQSYTTYIYVYQKELKELLINDLDEVNLENGETLMNIDNLLFEINQDILHITLTHQEKTIQSYISIYGGTSYAS